MKVNEYQFRELYQKVLYVAGISGQEYAQADEATGAMVYCYVDHTAGLSFWLLGNAIDNDDSLNFFQGDAEQMHLYRYGAIENNEADIVEDETAYEFYKETIDFIEQNYNGDENLQLTRKITDVDHLRHPAFPDDIQVHLVKEKCNTENCWVRMEKFDIEAKEFEGILLNTPTQKRKFGVREGDMINFFACKDEIGEVVCVAEFN